MSKKIYVPYSNYINEQNINKKLVCVPFNKIHFIHCKNNTFYSKLSKRSIETSSVNLQGQNFKRGHK